MIITDGICCFTGHRDFERTATPREILIFEKLTDNLIRNGYTVFKAGGALGFDTVAAEYILKRRAEGWKVRLELVLPCANQTAKWSFPQKKRYETILNLADRVDCLYPQYVDGCMHERNRRMVDESSACVAFCNRTGGGSYNTVQYARERGLSVYNIAEMATLL